MDEIEELRATVKHLSAQMLELQALAIFRKSEAMAVRSLLEIVAEGLKARGILSFEAPITKQVGDWILRDVNAHLAGLADTDQVYASALQRQLDLFLAQGGSGMTLEKAIAGA